MSVYQENLVEEVETLLPETPRLKSVSFSELPVQVKEDDVGDNVGDNVVDDVKEDVKEDVVDEETTTKETQTDVEMGIQEESPENEESVFLEGIEDEEVEK